jgi:hypothetical protein
MAGASDVVIDVGLPESDGFAAFFDEENGRRAEGSDLVREESGSVRFGASPSRGRARRISAPGEAAWTVTAPDASVQRYAPGGWDGAKPVATIHRDGTAVARTSAPSPTMTMCGRTVGAAARSQAKVRVNPMPGWAMARNHTGRARCSARRAAA